LTGGFPVDGDFGHFHREIVSSVQLDDLRLVFRGAQQLLNPVFGDCPVFAQPGHHLDANSLSLLRAALLIRRMGVGMGHEHHA
jgi:hypothetical protein